MSDKELTIHGETGGKGGGHTPVEAKDTLSSKQTIRLLFALSEGEISGVDDILVNGTTISAYAETCKYTVRTGTLDQTIIPGFSDVEAPLGVPTQQELKYNVNKNYTILGQYDAVRITLSIDRLMQIKDNGDQVGYSVNLEIWKRPITASASTWTLASKITKSGKCTNPYAWDVRVDRPAGVSATGSWEIMVKRTSVDDSSNKNYSKTYLSNIITITEKQLTYPKTALVGVELTDAAQFGGNVPEIKFKVKGIKLYLPSNYNATTRTYSEVTPWNGAFKTYKEYTPNLAWVMYWCLCDSNWGLGIPTSMVDLGSAYTFAKHCDQAVPDGKGGTEPRYTINYQFIERNNVPTFLTYLKNIGNVNFATNELGQIKFIFDAAGQAITKVESNASVVDGLFTYTSSDLESRTNLVNVTYARDEFYGDSDTVTHTESSLVSRYGLQTSDIVLLGCTSEAQALRKARWALYTNCYATDIVIYKKFLQGAAYSLGELVSIMDSDNVISDAKHAVITNATLTGTSTVLTLDRTIVLPNTQYTVKYIAPDGTLIQNKTINEKNGSFTTVTIAGAYLGFVGTTILFESSTLTARTVKVIKLEKDENQIYTVTGVTHREDKYAYIDSVGTLPVNRGTYINFDNFTVPPVTAITVEEIYVSTATIDLLRLHITWSWANSTSETIYPQFEISYTRDNQGYTKVGGIATKSFDIDSPIPGVYEIIVYAVNPFSGIKSVATIYTYNYRIVGATSTLEPPTKIVVPNTNGTIFSGADLYLWWPYNTNNDSKKDKLSDYIVEILDLLNVVKTSYTVNYDTSRDGNFLFSYDQNMGVFGAATRKFKVRVYSRDLVGDLSNYIEAIVENPAPTISQVSVYGNVGAATIYATMPTDPDVDAFIYKQYATATSTTASNTIISKSNTIDFPASLGIEYFYTVAAKDPYGVGAETTKYAASAISLDADVYTYEGLNFKPNDPVKNSVSWATFSVSRNGKLLATVSAGNMAWTTGTMYIYYVPGQNILRGSTSLLVAIQAGGRILGTYRGGTDITADQGRAFISGDQLLAGTVGANALVTNTAVITNMAQIGNILQSDNFSNTSPYSGWRLDKNGTLTANSILIRDADGQVIFASNVSGVTEGFDWNNVNGTNLPSANATRNVSKGLWKNGETYIIGDFVSDASGNSWSCITTHIADTTNNKLPTLPTTTNTNWTLLAAKGLPSVLVDLSKDTVTLGANADGSIKSYDVGTVEITVTEGSNISVCDGVYAAGATITAGTWKFAIASTNNITPPLLSKSGSKGIVAAPTGGVDPLIAASEVKLNIYGTRFTGESFSATKSITYVKSIAGKDGADTSVKELIVANTVAFKDSEDKYTSGIFAPIVCYGQMTTGTQPSVRFGYVTITEDGGIESGTAVDTSINSYIYQPIETSRATSFTVRLYDKATVASAKLLDIQTIPVIFKAPAGADGHSAASFDITTTGATFKQSQNGIITPTNLTITTQYQNFDSTPSYVWKRNGSVISNAIASSFIISNSEFVVNKINTYSCEITGLVNGVSTTLKDSITIPVLTDGDSGLSILISNENITFPAPSTGFTGIDYTVGSSEITAFLGTIQLTAVASTVITGNTFAITNINKVGVTLGVPTISADGKKLIIPAPTAMSADTAYAEFTITSRNPAGIIIGNTTTGETAKVRITYSVSRNGTNGADAKYVSISGDQVFLYPSGATAPTVGAITLSANLFGGLTQYNWYYVNSAGSLVTLNATGSTLVLTHDLSVWFSDVLKIRCISNSSQYYDEVSITKLRQGKDGTPGGAGANGTNAITLILSNENIAIPCDSAGIPVANAYTGANGTITVYDGITAYAGNSTQITSKSFSSTNSSASVSFIGASYFITATPLDSTVITISVVYKNALGNSITLTKVVNVTKVKAGKIGVGGVVATLGNDSCTVPCDASGAPVAFIGTNNTVKVYEGSTVLSPIYGIPVAGTYYITMSSYGVGLPIPAYNVDSIAVPNITSLTVDSGYVTYTVVGKTTDGRDFSISKIQNITKSRNGAAGDKGLKGDTGTTGARTTSIEMYLWSSTVPNLFPQGVSVYDWASGSFSAPATPNGWSRTPGNATAQGQTLYSCGAYYTDNLTSANSNITWPNSNYAIAIGSSGYNGQSPIVVSQLNELVNLMADANGTPLSYTTLGNTISVFEGSRQLMLDANVNVSKGPSTVTPVDSGRFNIAVQFYNVDTSLFTPSTSGYMNGAGGMYWAESYKQDGAGTIYTSRPAQVQSNAATTITYVITGRSYLGVPFSKNIVQKINILVRGTKGEAGPQFPTVDIVTIDPLVFIGNDQAAATQAASGKTYIQITANVGGITPTSYAWYFSGFANTTGMATNQQSVIVNASNFGISQAATATVVVNGNPLYTDTVTFSRSTRTTAEPYATVGATIGTNLKGLFDSGQVRNYFTTAAIDQAYIGSLDASKISAGMFSAVKIGVDSSSTKSTFFETAFPNIVLRSTATGYLQYSGGAGSTIITASQLTFKNGNSYNAPENNIRSGYVYFEVICTATIDHYFSIWYSVNGGAWGAAAMTVEPQSSYGTGAVIWAGYIYVRTFGQVQFGMRPTNLAGAYWNAGKSDIQNGCMSVKAYNF